MQGHFEEHGNATRVADVKFEAREHKKSDPHGSIVPYVMFLLMCVQSSPERPTFELHFERVPKVRPWTGKEYGKETSREIDGGGGGRGRHKQMEGWTDARADARARTDAAIKFHEGEEHC